MLLAVAVPVCAGEGFKEGGKDVGKAFKGEK
jgi:hypothetical protein